MNLMKFDPATGAEKPYPSHPEQYRAEHGLVAWLYDPFTGKPRDPRDIGSDTFGLLLPQAPQAAVTAMAVPAKRFTVNGDGTVTDHLLRLRWTHATVARSVNADKAEATLGDLGEKFGGPWRVPTVDELMTLPDRSRHSPAIDTEIFPDTENAYYWTGTPTAWNKSAVWVVDFGYGVVNGLRRSLSGCLRAVSELPAGQ